MRTFDRHRSAVSEIGKELGGTTFSKAPFDILTDDAKFFEVKCPSPRKGKHSSECRITVSEEERRFGEIMPLTFIILFKGKRYLIPFATLRNTLLKNRVNRHSFGNVIREDRQITLGKKFLESLLK